jgi:23S rRNA (cytidine1920-2'-O)/16S rRNA (cytidine1409-2'-O)-methyltransferase
MVKPQFEVGKERLGSGGVVRDPELRAESVLGVIDEAAKLGLVLRGVTASPLPGPSGNVEYFVWLVKAPLIKESMAESTVDAVDRTEAERLVRTAVEEGPA